MLNGWIVAVAVSAAIGAVLWWWTRAQRGRGGADSVWDPSSSVQFTHRAAARLRNQASVEHCEVVDELRLSLRVGENEEEWGLREVWLRALGEPYRTAEIVDEAYGRWLRALNRRLAFAESDVVAPAAVVLPTESATKAEILEPELPIEPISVRPESAPIPMPSEPTPYVAAPQAGRSQRPPDVEEIVPLIKCAEDVRARGYHWWAEHLAGDLWVVYAESTSKGYRFLERGSISQFPEGTILNQALHNLRQRIPDIEVVGDGRSYYMLTAGGELESSLLLVDGLWDELLDHVTGDLVVGVPSRDVVLFAGTDDSLRELQNAACLDVEAPYPISSQLLVRRRGEWLPLEVDETTLRQREPTLQ